MHELIIDLHLMVVGVFGDDAGHDAGDSGGVIAFEHACPLVPLLHVEAAHVLKALYGIADALIAQVRLTEAYPFCAELALLFQQRHEIAGHRGDAPGALCAYYELGRYVDKANAGASGHGGFI